MRTGIFFLLLIFSLPLYLAAQSKQVDVSGIIIINGSSTLSYKLVFTDSVGYLKGYSVTDVHRKDETKARIEGKIDRKEQTISYKETAIISSKALSDTTQLCMVQAKLKYRQASKGMMLTGNFTGTELNTGKECAKGTITMLNTEALNELFYPNPQKDTIASVEKVNTNKPVPNLTDTFTTHDEITQGIETVYDWRSDTVLLDLWDGGQIDYDVVTILYNKDTILKNYTLKAEKIRLRIPVISNGADMDQLTIIAENEGNEPPNTANLTLIDETKKYNVIAYNNVGQKAVINIKRISGR